MSSLDRGLLIAEAGTKILNQGVITLARIADAAERIATAQEEIARNDPLRQLDSILGAAMDEPPAIDGVPMPPPGYPR